MTSASFLAKENKKIYPDPEIHKFHPSCIYNTKSRIHIDTKTIEGTTIYVWDYIENNEIGVLSLDVFDTFLLRNNKPEALRYMEMSRAFLDELRKVFGKDRKVDALTPEDVCEARVAGMRATYRTRSLVQGCGEGLIHEVYAMQCLMLGLPEEAKDILADVEIKYETENLHMNPVFSVLAKKARGSGRKVILVSDMYLPARMIERIIQGVGEEGLYDNLYSSADLVISKRSGKIFPYLEEELQASGRHFLHVGDSWVGDVVRPREAGWHAMHFPVSRHEVAQRTKNLAKFIDMMDRKGIDTRSWAKM